MHSLFTYLSLSLWILCISSTGCKTEPLEEAAEPIEVEVLRVSARDLAERFELGGILKAEETAVVTAEINGTVESQFFRDGDRVVQGDVLLVFDKEPFSLNLGSATATLRKAEVSHEDRRNEFERRQKLKQEGFLSEEEVDNAHRLFRLAEADLEVARSSLRLIQRDLKKTEVHAPIPGIIVRRYRDLGEQLPPGTPLFKIADTRHLRVVIGLSEEQVLSVKPEDEVEVRFKPYSGRSFSGKVKRVGVPDSVSGGTFPVEVVLPNPDQLLKPGMVSKVSFTGRVHQGIFLVPRDAVIKRLGQELVYVVRNNVVVRTAVTRGKSFGFKVSVSKGLAPGDQVIIIGQDQVYEGAPVKIRKVSEEIDA